MDKVVVDYYEASDEASRLVSPYSLERLRTQEILGRFLARPLRVADIGGGPGLYSFWLADQGHAVTLVDITPRHIEQARDTNRGRSHPLEALLLGDACQLDLPDQSFDLVLLMGPLYHLMDSNHRVKALGEAARILKPDGILVAATISRYASLVDGFLYDLVKDPDFRTILDRDLVDGNHINTTPNPEYFTSAHLHTVEEIEAEVARAGLQVRQTLAVEGWANAVPHLERRLGDPAFREYLLQKLAQTEADRSLLGISAHFLIIASRP